MSVARFPTWTVTRPRLHLGWSLTRYGLIATLMGGGFGGKEDIAGQIHVALLAQVTERPVKMLYSRQESLLFHPKRHATVIRIRTGATREGQLTAVEATLYGDGGAYASLSEKVLTRATTHASGPYDVPHVKVDCFAAYTNNAPCGAFRGFGVSQSCFAVESNMDILAEQLGLDAVEFRRMNALDVGLVTATGQEMRESVGLNECISACRCRICGLEIFAGPGRKATGILPGVLRLLTKIPVLAVVHRINPAPRSRYGRGRVNGMRRGANHRSRTGAGLAGRTGCLCSRGTGYPAKA